VTLTQEPVFFFFSSSCCLHTTREQTFLFTHRIPTKKETMASVDVQQPSASELMLKRMMSQQQREYEAEQALQEKKAAGEEVDELGVQYPSGRGGQVRS